MKYSIIPEADGPIKCHCNGELYLALEMENLSLTEGYPVQPVPWRQSANAREAGRLKSQFMRSAKLPVRDGAAGSPQDCSRPSARMTAHLSVDEPGRRGYKHFPEDVDVAFPDRPEALDIEGGLDEADAKRCGLVPDLFEHQAHRSFAIADVPDGINAAEFRVRMHRRAPYGLVRPLVANADNVLPDVIVHCSV